MASYPHRITLVEVGPRDGFQMEDRFIPTDLKVELTEELVNAGVREIEAVSFVHPRVIPQMRDAVRVAERLVRREDVCYWALIPNLTGAERALAAEMDGLHQVICSTETYNRRNVGLSIDESLAQLRQVVERAAAAPDRGGRRVRVAATMAVTFGCPFEGQVSDERLVELAQRFAETGIEQLGLADSAGLGHPVLVERIVAKIRAALPDLPLRMHLHDTRGLGMANAMAALGQGVDTFDTSFGGLGGCPIMRGASGNLATEDFNNLCQELGLDTGVKTSGVASAARRIQAFLGRSLPSKILQSGTRAELYELNRVKGQDAAPGES